MREEEPERYAALLAQMRSRYYARRAEMSEAELEEFRRQNRERQREYRLLRTRRIARSAQSLL